MSTLDRKELLELKVKMNVMSARLSQILSKQNSSYDLINQIVSELKELGLAIQQLKDKP